MGGSVDRGALLVACNGAVKATLEVAGVPIRAIGDGIGALNLGDDGKPDHVAMQFATCRRPAYSAATPSRGVRRDLPGFPGWTARILLANGLYHLHHQPRVLALTLRRTSFPLCRPPVRV